MNSSLTTTSQLNNLIEFRQAVYSQGFTQRRDAQFELLDALLLAGPIQSFADLSRVAVFQRRWTSVYAAIEDGVQDTERLRQLLLQQVSDNPRVVVVLDATAWPRPQSPSVADCQYVYSPTGAIDQGHVVVGQPYSMLGWVAPAQRSWVLPLDVQRIASHTDALTVGIAQVKLVCRQRAVSGVSGTLVVAADGKHGNHIFLGGLRDTACQVVVRLRRDRVLFGPPGPYSGKGRRPKHGARFAFKDATTWGQPDQQGTLTDARWGQVDLKYWSGRHAYEDAATVFGVLRIQVHQERATPPDALWLAWQGPPTDAETIWRTYQQRWGIEPSIKHRKQDLHWTRPQFQSTAAMDRWTMLVSLAQWQLYLARELVQDAPLPWQKPQTELTPGRVRQSLGPLFVQLGSPAAPPKRRGMPPGWPTGRVRTPPVRHAVVKKPKKPPGKSRQSA